MSLHSFHQGLLEAGHLILGVTQRDGREHADQALVADNFRKLLQKRGLSSMEIEERLNDAARPFGIQSGS